MLDGVGYVDGEMEKKVEEKVEKEEVVVDGW